MTAQDALKGARLIQVVRPKLPLARYMGTSVEMIERTYGHLVEGADDLFRSRLDAFSVERSGVDVASASESGSENASRIKASRT